MMFNLIDLRQMDLNLLVVFETVFRERSVKAAAGKLLVGQSAVSMALGRLRELVDDELFVKVAGGVEPTAKAAAIEPQVRQALELVHAAVYEPVTFEPASSSRTIRVALSDDLQVWLLPALLDDVRAAAPGVTMVIRPSHWYTAVTLIEQGDADVALGIFPTAGSSMMVESLFQERFASLFDPKYVKAPLTMKRFLTAPHAMVSITGDLVGLVDEALRLQGKERRVVMTVPGFAALGPLVCGRDLIATMPGMAAKHFAGSLKLATAKPPVPVGPLPVSMAWHSKTDRDAALHWFRQRVRLTVRRLLAVE